MDAEREPLLSAAENIRIYHNTAAAASPRDVHVSDLAAQPPPPRAPSSRIESWISSVDDQLTAQRNQHLVQASSPSVPIVGFGALPKDTTAALAGEEEPDREFAYTPDEIPEDALTAASDELSDAATDAALLRHAAAKVGYIKGVTIPTCEFMWSVLIFVRFSWILGQTGLVLGISLIFLCAATVAATATSISAIATNGYVRDGVVEILTQTLGSGIGGAIALIFGIGVAMFSSVEVVGSVQGLLEAGKLHVLPGENEVWDQRILAISCLAFLTTVAYIGHRAVMRLSIIFLVALIGAYSSLFLGFALAPRINDFGGLVTGWSWTTLQGNLWPAPTLDVTSVLSLLFPCFLGMWVSVNNASNLRNPFTAIPRGSLTSVAISVCLYTGIFVCLACLVERPLLLSHFTVAPELAWPAPQIAIIGLFLVGNGSALHCLVLSSEVVCTLASENVLPISRSSRWVPAIYRRSGEGNEPRVALLVCAALASPLMFFSELETLATFVAMCFLLCYEFTNVSCTVLEWLRLPMWRPVYRGYHWGLSMAAAAACLTLMVHIHLPATVGLLILTAIAFYWIERAAQSSGAQGQWGHAIHGILYSLALTHLLAVEKLEINELKRAYCFDLCRSELEDIAPRRAGLPHGAMSRAPDSPEGTVVTTATSALESAAVAQAITNRERNVPDTLLVIHEPSDEEQREVAAVAPACPHLDRLADASLADLRNALWKPQIIAFFGMPHGQIQHPRLLSLVAQLSARGGLCVLSHIVVPSRIKARRAQRLPHNSEDDLHSPVTTPMNSDDEGDDGDQEDQEEAREDVQIAAFERHARRRKLLLHMAMMNEGLEGFVKVFICPSVRVGQSVMLQTVGLGELSANTVLVAWPERGPNWQDNLTSVRELAHLYRLSRMCGQNVLVVKGCSKFPASDAAPRTGTVDIWWVVNEGSLIVLVAYILRQHRVWKRTRLRLFAVAREGEDIEGMRAMLEWYLLVLRVKADLVEVVPIPVAEDEVDVEAALNAELRAEEQTVSESEGSMASPRKSSVSGPGGASASGSHSRHLTGRSRTTGAFCHVAVAMEAGVVPPPDAVDLSLLPGIQPTPVSTIAEAAAETAALAEAVAAAELSGQEPPVSDSPREAISNDATEVGPGDLKDADSQALPVGTPKTPLIPSFLRPRQKQAPFLRRTTIAALRDVITQRSQGAELVLINLPSMEESANLFGLAATRRAGAVMELFEYVTKSTRRCILVHATGRTREMLNVTSL